MAPRKGTLESILLSDLFQSLAEGQATGMLTVTNDEDTKRIVLEKGQISVSSTGMSEKVLLGDLLVARGVVSDEDIEKALAAQKAQHRKLGEILVDMGLVTPKNIEDSIKFQVEEEILDLFTWRKGSFEFNDELSEADLKNLSDMGTAFKIDARTIISEASARADEWRQLEQRITSPFLVFQPTEKALSVAIQKEIGSNPLKKRVFMWIQENRTVDTMVRKSCIGRNLLYKLLITWLDERYTELVPVGQLKFMASEHRSRHRYYDAMGIYRRLKEAARTDQERRELEAVIHDTKMMMEAQKATASGMEVANQTAAMSHLKRAALQRRSRLIRLAGVYGGGGVLVLVVLFYLSLKLGTDRTKEYEAALANLDASIHVQIESEQFSEALQACDRLTAQFPNLAKEVNDRTALVNKQHADLATRKRLELRDQLGRLDVNDIKNRLDQLAEKFKDIPGYASQIKADRVELDQEVVQRTESLRSNSQNKWLLIGQIHQELGEFGQARLGYFRASALAGDKDPVQADIQSRLKQMADIENQQREALHAACSLDLAGSDLKAALTKYQEVAAMKPQLSWGQQAQRRAAELQKEIDDADRQLQVALNLPSDTDTGDLEKQLRQTVIQLAPFATMIGEVKQRLNSMVERRKEIEAQVKIAQDLDRENKPDQARAKWSELLLRYRSDLVRRNLSVPYTVKSNPAGADVVVGADKVGVTPCTFRVPASDQRPIEIRLAGFSPHRLAPDEMHKLYADVTLYVDPAWTFHLTAGACHGLVFLNNDLYVVSGGTLVCLRPSTKSSLFDPKEIIKIPNTERKRQALNFTSEAKPPEWWALQQPPTFTQNKDALWLPVQDCRLVRLSTLDLEMTEIHCPIEAATPMVIYKNPFVRDAELAVFIGLDSQMYQPDLQDFTQEPKQVSKFKYKPLEVQPAGDDYAYAVDEAGQLVRLPIGDFDTAKAFPLNQPIAGDFRIFKGSAGAGEDPGYFALAIESDGGLELADLKDVTRVWLQSPADFNVRTIRLIDEGQKYLQTGVSAGHSKLEMRTTNEGGQSKLIWSQPVDGNALRPCVSSSTVYLATDDKILHAFRRSDGKPLWKSPVPGLPEFIEAHADGTVALVVKKEDGHWILFFKVEQPGETPAP